MTNLLLYCSMILVNAPLSMRLKVIDFFIQICEPLTESTSTIQDLLRKLLDIPSIFKSIFQPIIWYVSFELKLVTETCFRLKTTMATQLQ